MNKNLLAACKALLTMSGGPEGLDMGGPVDPRTVRQQAVAAIAEAESTPEVLYLAHEGEYSDRRVVGVFSTKEAAAAKSADNEEWILDNDYEVAGNYQMFVVDMDRDGNTKNVHIATYFNGYILEPQDMSPWNQPGVYRFREITRDIQHAVKVANEKRARLIAEGKWL